MNKKVAQFISGDEDITDVFETITDDGKGNRTTQQSKLEDILSDLNDTSDEVELRVYRQSPLGGKASMSFLDSFPPDKYSMSQLQMYLKENYGGGDYRVHVRVNGALKANRLITIEDKLKREGVSRTPASEAGDIIQVVTKMMERQQQEMMTLFNNRPSEEDFLQKMIMYKQLFDNGGSQGSQVDAISQLKNTVELLGDLGLNVGGQKEKEEGFVDVIEKMAPMIGAIAQGKNTNQYTQAGNTKMFANIKLKMGIAQLLKGAVKRSDPAFYSDIVLDQVEPEIIKKYIVDPNALNELAKVNPEVTKHKEWFLDVMEHVKGQIGMPSKYAAQYSDGDASDLHDSDDSVINGETEPEK